MAGSNNNFKIPSETFCVYPWIEQVVQSNGKISFCCVAKNGGMLKKPDGTNFRAAVEPLESAWNSDHLKEIRRAMLAGERVSECELCYFQESIGKRSYREMHNEEWLNKAGSEIHDRVAESIKNEMALESPALYLDLRLGNLCNLKCRSCNPYNSSQIFKETVKLYEEDEEYRSFWNRFNGGKPPAPTPEWYESDMFWDEVIDSMPRLRKVYLTGGEPTLIEKNYKFMQACVDSGHSKHIFLMFNTNCTNIQSRFLEYMPHFEFVLINASIDGFGKENEYMRFLSRWETVNKNFGKITDLSENVQVGVTPVLQIYNVLTITKLLDHIESIALKTKRDINVDFLYATDPPYIDVRILPKSIKDEAIRRLEAYIQRSRTYAGQRFLRNSIDSCITLLKDNPEKNDTKIKDLMQYTRMLDQNRKQKLDEYFPDLHAMLRDEGYSLYE